MLQNRKLHIENLFVPIVVHPTQFDMLILPYIGSTCQSYGKFLDYMHKIQGDSLCARKLSVICLTKRVHKRCADVVFMINGIIICDTQMANRLLTVFILT